MFVKWENCQYNLSHLKINLMANKINNSFLYSYNKLNTFSASLKALSLALKRLNYEFYCVQPTNRSHVTDSQTCWLESKKKEIHLRLQLASFLLTSYSLHNYNTSRNSFVVSFKLIVSIHITSMQTF